VHDEFGLIRKLHAITGFMELPMMRAAEQHHPVDIGSATVDPVIDVMHIAMLGFCSTPRCSAVSVASDDCSSLRCRRCSDFATQVQHLGTCHEHPLHN
jgi:hypothetical protein